MTDTPKDRNINYTIPWELHRRLQVEAARRGVTLHQLVIELLDAALQEAAP